MIKKEATHNLYIVRDTEWKVLEAMSGFNEFYSEQLDAVGMWWLPYLQRSSGKKSVVTLNKR